MINLEQGNSMTEALMNRIKAQLVRHEGLRLKPYRCTAGKLTIGIGRNLDFCSISHKTTYTMLERDIQDCEQRLIEEKSSYYWHVLVEHTALRIRECGRMQSYKQAKVRYYKLVVILDDCTIGICLALVT